MNNVRGRGGCRGACRGDQDGVLFLPRQSIVHEPRYIGTPQVNGHQQKAQWCYRKKEKLEGQMLGGV